MVFRRFADLKLGDYELGLLWLFSDPNGLISKPNKNLYQLYNNDKNTQIIRQKKKHWLHNYRADYPWLI